MNWGDLAWLCLRLPGRAKHVIANVFQVCEIAKPKLVEPQPWDLSLELREAFGQQRIVKVVSPGSAGLTLCKNRQAARFLMKVLESMCVCVCVCVSACVLVSMQMCVYWCIFSYALVESTEWVCGLAAGMLWDLSCCSNKSIRDAGTSTWTNVSHPVIKAYPHS